MGDKVSLTVRISPGQRDRWQSFVDDSPDIESLAGLCRMCVEETIREEESGGAAAEEVLMRFDDIDGRVERTENELDELRNEVTSMHDTLREVHERTVQKNRVFRLLPESEEEAVTVSDIAGYIDRPEDVARVLVDELVLEMDISTTDLGHGKVGYHR